MLPPFFDGLYRVIDLLIGLYELVQALTRHWMGLM
jgi:hypothetical protein